MALKEALSFFPSLSFSRERRVLLPKRKRKWFWGRTRDKKERFPPDGTSFLRESGSPAHEKSSPPVLSRFETCNYRTLSGAYGCIWRCVHHASRRCTRRGARFSRFLSVGTEGGEGGGKDSGTRVKHMRPRSGGLYPPVIGMVCAFQPPSLSLSLALSLSKSTCTWAGHTSPFTLGRFE